MYNYVDKFCSEKCMKNATLWYGMKKVDDYLKGVNSNLSRMENEFERIKSQRNEIQKLKKVGNSLIKKGIDIFVDEKFGGLSLIAKDDSLYNKVSGYDVRVFSENREDGRRSDNERSCFFDLYFKEKGVSVFVRPQSEYDFLKFSNIYSKFKSCVEAKEPIYPDRHREFLEYGASISEIIYFYSSLRVPKKILSKLDKDLIKIRSKNPVKDTGWR